MVGENLTVKFTDCPAATVIGKLAPEILNPFPLTDAEVTERLDPPVFDTFRVCVELVFAVRLPKLRVVGETAICGGVDVTVTLADADLVPSAALVAFTV